MKLNSMKLISTLLIIFTLLIAQHVFAGLDSYELKDHRFKYDIKGEMRVKPDKAVFPIIITVESTSCVKSLNIANSVVNKLSASIKKLNNEVFDVQPVDFFKKNNRQKFNVSFFGGKKKGSSATKLVAFFTVSFSQDHGFTQRSQFMAESLDFITKFRNDYRSEDHIMVYSEASFLEISNVEQYRAKIVKSVYQKARSMAEIIGEQENISPKIKEVFFDQYIQEEIINFNDASLSINAKIEYTYD